MITEYNNSHMNQRLTKLAPLVFAVFSITLMGQGCMSFLRTDINLNERPTPSIEPAIELEQFSLNFEHKIGTTKCPQAIANVNITAKNLPATAVWKTEQDAKSTWLEVTKTGTMSEPVQLSFNCKLDEYTDQTLEGVVTVTAVDPAKPTKILASNKIYVHGIVKK